VLLTILFLLVAAWVSGEAYQWLLRWRAERLLSDIRSLQVNRSGWTDAEQVMTRWGQWGVSSPSCTMIGCAYRINLIQSLPPVLGGYPDKGVKNWLPKLVGYLGLRGAAVRAEFTVQHGLVTAKWFSEQVTLPVQDWNHSADYVPYMTATAGQNSTFHDHILEQHPLHPNRVVQIFPNVLVVSYAQDEDPSEQALLMDFRFSCITRLRPCGSMGEMLPEGWRMLQEKQQQAGTR
jgi:hypothetical protein